MAQKSPDRDEKPKASAAGQALGLVVSELTEAQRKELKLKGGVRVDAATEAAQRAGIREGDIIVAIANAEVASMKDFDAVLAKADRSKPLNILYRRGDWVQYAVIRPPR